MYKVILYHPSYDKGSYCLTWGTFEECLTSMIDFANGIQPEANEFIKDALWQLVQVITKPDPAPQGIFYGTHFTQLELERAAELWREVGWSCLEPQPDTNKPWIAYELHGER